MTGVIKSTANEPPAPRRAGGGFRAFLDAMLCLYIAVILFRTFELEGYIISTGSMAPSLLGFHKRVVCPSCGYHFPFGIAVDIPGAAADTTGSEAIARALPHRGAMRCPNCGQDAIDGDGIPPNYGDQLLVQKNAYEFRRPRRWEVVVLNGPVRPVPPFVKRIVGLPNEAVQIVDGDIYANGRICRKDLDEQRALRIPVFDNDYVPDDPPEGRGDWVIEPAKSPWRVQGHGFSVSATTAKLPSWSQGEISWLAFHRWVRHGGTYRTEVPVDALPQNVHVSHGAYPQLRYDPTIHRFLLIGALDKSERDRLLVTNTDPKVRAAIGTLYNRSHDGPVTDDYGYNRADTGLVPMRVRDIMLECGVAFESDTGQAAVRDRRRPPDLSPDARSLPSHGTTNRRRDERAAENCRAARESLATVFRPGAFDLRSPGHRRDRRQSDLPGLGMRSGACRTSAHAAQDRGLQCLRTRLVTQSLSRHLLHAGSGPQRRGPADPARRGRVLCARR